jgi:cell division septum initiation protein DivIVA
VSTFDVQDGPDSEALVRQVIEIIESTRTLPLSSSVKLDNREEVLELLEDALERLPGDLRQARWMLKERDEYLAKMRREGEQILQAARLQAERMVQRTEIVREAQHTARDLVEKARDEARRLRLEAEDYADQKLAAFEIVLERTLKTVAAGRQKLAATPGPAAGIILGERQGGEPPAPGSADETIVASDAFFDQDRFG